MELWGVQQQNPGPTRVRLGLLVPALVLLGLLLWQAVIGERVIQLAAQPLPELVAFGFGVLFARLLADCTPKLGSRQEPGYWQRMLAIWLIGLSLPLAIPAVYCALMLGLPEVLQQWGIGA